VETAMQNFLVSVPQAAALWVLMIFGVFLLAGVLARRTRPVEPAFAEAESDARRYAGEISVAAGRPRPPSAAAPTGPAPSRSWRPRGSPSTRPTGWPGRPPRRSRTR
jgi:hypothetical protein